MILFQKNSFVCFFAVKVVGWVYRWVVIWEPTKPNQRLVKEEEKKNKEQRKMSDEIDNLVQLNRDKFQSSTLNYSTKPKQTSEFLLIFSFHLIDVSFDCFTFFEFSLIEIELSFRFKSQLCFSNLLINCDNSPTHNWLNNQSNMSCMNLNLIYSKQTIVWLKGLVWFWFLVWDFELKNWFNDW